MVMKNDDTWRISAGKMIWGQFLQTPESHIFHAAYFFQCEFVAINEVDVFM